MTISPFGWNDNAPPYLSAENLEAMHQAAGAYTDSTAIPKTQRGAASGVAPLDSGSLLPVANLPTSVVTVDSHGRIPASQIPPQVPWLGLNGNSQAATSGYGPLTRWSSIGIVYDRLDVQQPAAPSTIVALVNASVAAGMIPVINVESSGYRGGAMPTGTAITAFANYFVSVVQAVQAAQPNVRCLFEIENEPWGSWYWTNAGAAVYADEVVGVIQACQAANIDLTVIYPMVQDENFVSSMYTQQPTLKTTAAPEGWSVHPYGVPPPGFNTGDGIAWVPTLRPNLSSGQDNILISEIGFDAGGVNGAAVSPGGGPTTWNDKEAVSFLYATLRKAQEYRDAGWLTALLLYSRNDSGWAMELAGGTLTALGTMLSQFPTPPDTVTDPPVITPSKLGTEMWHPSDDGWHAATFDPVCAVDSVFTGAGQIYLARVRIDARFYAQTVTMHQQVAGVGLTNCFVGLYDEAGALLDASADQSANLTGTGDLNLSLPGRNIGPGYYYIALLVGSSTTAPQFAGNSNASGGAAVTGRYGSTPARFMNTSASTYTSLPATLDISSSSSAVNRTSTQVFMGLF